MKILVVEPEKTPYEKEIDDSLEAMQEIVGGYIEAIYPFEDLEVALVCNEEGKIENLPLNRALYSFESRGEIIDIVAGTFFICSAPSDSGKFESLTDAQIDWYKAMFYPPEEFYLKSDNSIGVRWL